jgi:peptidoglycan hydrolase-like protein with peptidoglycan-binding domain
MSYPDVLLKKGTDLTQYVKQLKERLNALGFGPLNQENGNFGDTTLNAVIAFQRSRLLNPDGEVGPLTWHRLFTDRIAVIPIAKTLSGIALEICLSQLYVREKTGKNDGPEVELYLASVGLGKGNPYCLAFQYWAEDTAAHKLTVSNPMYKTGHVLTLWNQTRKEYKFQNPEKGDLGIMDFGGGKGHIFRVKKVIGNKVNTVEGNTSGDPTSASEDRDGQGVFERLRLAHSKLIKGYIRYPD